MINQIQRNLFRTSDQKLKSQAKFHKHQRLVPTQETEAALQWKSLHCHWNLISTDDDDDQYTSISSYLRRKSKTYQGDSTRFVFFSLSLFVEAPSSSSSSSLETKRQGRRNKSDGNEKKAETIWDGSFVIYILFSSAYIVN